MVVYWPTFIFYLVLSSARQNSESGCVGKIAWKKALCLGACEMKYKERQEPNTDEKGDSEGGLERCGCTCIGVLQVY